MAKKDFYEMKAEVVKAAAHPLRIEIIDILSRGEMCVCDIARAVRSERSNVSRHLAVMGKAGVLKSCKHGLQVYYSLQTPCITGFLKCIDKILSHRLKLAQKALQEI